MSLSKELNQILITDKMKRQSFEERFCDDLCEEILQYLPLKEKIRFECVSKQFHRTIFNKQFEINGRDDIFWRKYFRGIRKTLSQQKFLFEFLVKKCPNIRSIYSVNSLLSINANEIFGLIIKYCDNLSQTDCPLQRMSYEIRKQFIEKFATKLKSLSQYFIFGTQIRDQINSINCFQNIEELSIDYNNSGYPKSCGELKLKKLKKLRINWLKADNALAKLLSNIENIEVLDINCDLLTDVGILTLMPQFLTFNNLIEFKLQNPSVILFNGDSQTQTYVRQMARNCPKLKSFRTQICLYGKSLKQLLSPLKQFKELKRLDIIIKSEIWSNFSFKAFEGFGNLTHLTLHFTDGPITDKILEGVDIYLPNLQFLEISSYLEPTDFIYNILSRLKNVKTIKLKFKNRYDCYYEIIKEIESQLLINCKKLIAIEIPKTVFRD